MCRRDATESSAKPFCSAHCRGLDLGNWIDESYRIPAEPGALDVAFEVDDAHTLGAEDLS